MSNFPNLALWQEPSTDANGLLTLDPNKINVHDSPYRTRPINQEHVNDIADEFTTLKQKGILPQTVILVAQSQVYEWDWDVVFGSHRVMAARQADTQILAQDGSDLDFNELLRAAIAENLLRKDPNPLEYTESIIRLVEMDAGYPLDKIKSILNWNKRGRLGGNVTPEEWERLESVFQSLPKPISPETFRRNYLPLLSLPEDVAECVRSGQLDYTKANELRKLDPEDANRIAIAASENNWSLEQVKAEIKKLSPSTPKVETLYRSIGAKLKAIQPDSLETKKRQRLDRLLKQIEELINDG